MAHYVLARQCDCLSAAFSSSFPDIEKHNPYCHSITNFCFNPYTSFPCAFHCLQFCMAERIHSNTLTNRICAHILLPTRSTQLTHLRLIIILPANRYTHISHCTTFTMRPTFSNTLVRTLRRLHRQDQYTTSSAAASTGSVNTNTFLESGYRFNYFEPKVSVGLLT